MSSEAVAPVVVVTGASAGVGRAIALRFARAGFDVGLIARDAEALGEVETDIGRRGVRSLALPLDVADADAVFAAADRVESRLGPIDFWINDAMVTVFSPLSEITPEEFRRVTEVTYLGFVHGTMAALKHMRPRNRGSVIQIGSALAYRGIPLQSAYCGAKHAVRGFTESIRSELVHDRSKVRIAMVDLPAVNTPQFDWARAHVDHAPRPMGAPVDPTVVADAVFRAAFKRGQDYWIGGTTALTVLGSALVPWFMDQYLAKAVEGQQAGRPVPPDRPDNLDASVPALHRVEGSFTDESVRSAALMSGDAMRLGVVAAGALICAGIGGALARRNRGG